MARSTYISENMTQQQVDFLRVLDDNELEIFSLQDLKKLAGKKFGDVNEIVENLVHKKLLSRIERAKYCKANFRDEKAIGCFLVPDGAIAYWSALNLHGYTEQFPNIIFIQTTKNKQETTVFGVTYKFIRINSAKRAGVIKQGTGSHSYRITDKEKTIVDCFNLFQYSGGYAELIKAYAEAELVPEKMIKYARAVNNIAAIKRMGYLAELLNKKNLKTFIRFAREQVNEVFNPFDPEGHDQGEYNQSWRLRMNITEKAILEITKKQY